MKLKERYDYGDELYRDESVVIYNGWDSLKSIPVRMISFFFDNISTTDYAQLTYEFNIIKSINSRYIIKLYDIVRSYKENRDVIIVVYEEFKGVALNLFLEHNRLTVEEFLELALLLAAGLADIHNNNLIHKSINPRNIIIDPLKREIKYVDFGFSAMVFSREARAKNLPYISPEQTGKVNRLVDYRTDFYSLGVILYRMLTGVLPFEGGEAAEIIHSHIARTPPAPDEIDSTLPSMLSKIIMKLLAKSASERYQSAGGLHRDLERCLKEYSELKEIKPFAPGTYDYSDKFLISYKLYGREREVELLKRIYKRVKSQGSELVIIEGGSGVGKTSLVMELNSFISGNGDRLISGRYQQFSTGAYRGIKEILTCLVMERIRDTPEVSAAFKSRVLQLPHESLLMIVDLIPELREFTGIVASPGAPSFEERKELLINALISFSTIFTEESRRLVIFLDDLQWADNNSLELLKRLALSFRGANVMFICSYRPDEMESPPGVEPSNEEMPTTRIILDELKEGDVTHWVSDTLRCSLEEGQPLAAFLLQKNRGYPLFIKTALQALYDDGLFYFSDDSHWHWDMDEIMRKVSESMTEILIKKISFFSGTSLALLKCAAALGDFFTTESLSHITGLSVDSIYQRLEPALKEEIIYRSGNNFRFIHDKIQEVIYSLVPEDKKIELHLEIGRVLAAAISRKELPQRVFEFIEHINIGIDLIKDEKELKEIARYNLIAGRREKSQAAYVNACNYFETGISIIEGGWEECYELALDLYNEAAETAYLSGYFKKMKRYISIISNHSRDIMDKILSYDIIIHYYISQKQFLKAVRFTVLILKRLGRSFPRKPGRLTGLIESFKLKGLLRKLDFSKIEALGPMSDERALASLRLITDVFPAALIARPDLLPLLAFKQVELTLKSGLAPYSAQAFANCGSILCAAGDYSRGYALGKLALTLDKGSNEKEIRSIASYETAYHTLHWHKHLKESIQLLEEAQEIALNRGCLNSAAFAANGETVYLFLQGETLSRLYIKIEENSALVRRLKQEKGLNSYNLTTIETVRNLIGYSGNLNRLQGKSYNEARFVESCLKARDHGALFYHYFCKLYLSYLFGRYEDGEKFALEGEKYIESISSSAILPAYYLYSSLIYLKIAEVVKGRKRRRLLQRIKRARGRLKRMALASPDNYSNKFYLLEAERERLKGRSFRAMKHYHRAITLAKANGFIHEEALALELAGHFYRTIGQDITSRSYLMYARLLYIQWGAAKKVEIIEQLQPYLEGPDLFLNTISSETPSTRGYNTRNLKEETANLDIDTVMRASLAISEEIDLKGLLEKLIRIIIENAGAQKGFLILKSGEELKIEAAANSDSQAVSVLQGLPLEQSDELSVNIVKTVFERGHQVVLGRASADSEFSYDPYIKLKSIKSLLCQPILQKEEIVGALYLENNLIANAFTKKRLKILEILLAQTSISLEKARLYEKIKLEIRERQRIQAQLLQAQKMEAVGTMAGGIAHDFNNILTAIMGSTDLALIQSEPDNPNYPFLEHIRDASQQASELTRQLLLFSRKQLVKPELLDINSSIKNLLKMLARLISVNIKIETIFELEIDRVMADRSSIEQVIMNLIVNARDAMPEGGKLVIKTDNVTLRGDETESSRKGSFVKISIEDSGTGIDSETMSRIFEPFFTTKRHNKGTGLGLAVAYSIVNQHKGWIEVESRENIGTLFTVYIPAIDASEESPAILSAADSEAGKLPEGNNETILVVEDMEEVRTIAVKALKKYGYQVIEAGKAEDALELFRQRGEEIALLFSDVVLPGKSGIWLAEELLKERADLPILLASGYADHKSKESLIKKEGLPFLHKPYTLTQLLNTIYKILND